MRTTAIALVATIGLAGTAFGQSTTPGATQPNLDRSGQPTAQSVNPSPMVPGSRANEAPGMGGRVAQPAAPANTANPIPMLSGNAPARPPSDPVAPRPTASAQPGGTSPGGAAPAVPGLDGATPPVGTTPQQAAGPLPGSQQPADPAAQRPGGSLPQTTEAPRAATATGATSATAPVQGGGQEAPLVGANSFTEAQARSRLADAGFGEVSQLTLDSQGIWRARGTRNGTPTDVALDYQGNIVPTR